MNEEVKNINFGTEDVNEESKKFEEELKKVFDEMKENDGFKSGDTWILLMLIIILFWNPLNKSDSSVDKQQIAYLSGKIEAYEKMLRGE